jgi:mycothiol system anti-sigma-R factor
MSEPSEPPDREPGPADRPGRVDCDQAIIEIYDYLDGELTVWKRSAIAKHLDDCPPCAQGFTFEIELRQVIATKCRDQVPPELKQRIAEVLGLDPPPA